MARYFSILLSLPCFWSERHFVCELITREKLVLVFTVFCCLLYSCGTRGVTVCLCQQSTTAGTHYVSDSCTCKTHLELFLLIPKLSTLMGSQCKPYLACHAEGYLTGELQKGIAFDFIWMTYTCRVISKKTTPKTQTTTTKTTKKRERTG